MTPSPQVACCGSLRPARKDTRVLGSTGTTGPTKAITPMAAAARASGGFLFFLCHTGFFDASNRGHEI